jgi:hypothetical protein
MERRLGCIGGTGRAGVRFQGSRFQDFKVSRASRISDFIIHHDAAAANDESLTSATNT